MLHQRATRRPPSHARQGMTLIDVLMAVSVLVVAVAITSVSISSSARYAEGARESVMAFEAAEAMLAELESRPFVDVFADYNDTDTDDGPDSPGAHFAVEGLDAQPGDEDGLPGRIFFPVGPGAPATLREDLEDPRFGLPADLDLDGTIDGNSKSNLYRLLPVRIEIEWRGQQGSARAVLEGMLSEW